MWPPVLSTVSPYLLATGQFAAHNWSWKPLRMNGTPASSPTAWRGAGRTCIYTCPDPLSLCGYLHPACLARERRTGELSKKDATGFEHCSIRYRKVILCVRYTSFFNTLNYFPFTLLIGWWENILSSCVMMGLAGKSFSLVSIAFIARTEVCISPIISLQGCTVLILWRNWKWDNQTAVYVIEDVNLKTYPLKR